MDKTAAEYEQLATVKMAAAASEEASPEDEALAIAEAQVFASLAVAQAIEKVWDKLSYINRKLQSRD